jgi:NAD(P)H-flavin reductase
MKIQKLTGVIKEILDLSPTAKEVLINFQEPFDFIAGSFVTIFMDIDGEKVRRAYSISSSDTEKRSITLSIRLSPKGKMTPLFWNANLIGQKIELMGPLGLNTADKMNKSSLYLFGFGIGAGVVKSLADHFSKKESVDTLVIMTGSRSEEEILYKNYFDTLAQSSPKIKIEYIVSQTQDNSNFKKGYIQNYLEDFDFNNSDVYVCGQEKACNELVEKVKKHNPINCDFFIEGFH